MTKIFSKNSHILGTVAALGVCFACSAKSAVSTAETAATTAADPAEEGPIVSAPVNPELKKLSSPLGANAALRGVWKSRGYGWVAEIHPSKAALYDHSRAGCLAVPADELSVGEMFRYADIRDALVVASDNANSTHYTFDRIKVLPSECAQPRATNPTLVVEYFWTLMDEFYPFFELRKVDWAERGREGRAKVRDDMTEDELFDLLSSMLRDLKDPHTSLRAKIGDKRREHEAVHIDVFDALKAELDAGSGPDEFEKAKGAWLGNFKKGVVGSILGGKMMRETGPLVWGRVGGEGKIGYVNLFAVAGFSDSDLLEDDVAAAHVVIGKMIDSLADTDAMIIDISVNSGGYDDVSRAIAGHFADKRTVAYSKEAYKANGLSPQKLYVEPATGSRYLKPVVVVTSDMTVSGGETLTMAFRALPQVTHVGVPTHGALSDMIPKALPNGWKLTMSMEIYRDTDGKVWEGPGVPPTETMTVFDRKALRTSHPALINAIAERLRRSTSK